MTSPLTRAEVAQFRALVKPAIVLLVMLRLDRPVSAKEIASILNLDQHTAARYLRCLSRLNLVTSAGYHQGYILLGGRQLILGEEPDVKNAHLPSISTTTIKMVSNRGSEGEVIVDSVRDVKNARHETAKCPRDVKKAQHPSTDSGPSPLLQALQDAGIGEPKRSAVATLPNLTPAWVKAWESHLKLAKGDRYSPGLLIHVLETGDPAVVRDIDTVAVLRQAARNEVRYLTFVLDQKYAHGTVL